MVGRIKDRDENITEKYKIKIFGGKEVLIREEFHVGLNHLGNSYVLINDELDRSYHRGLVNKMGNVVDMFF